MKSLRNAKRFIHATVIAQCKKPDPQTAHLVFAFTQSLNKKPKELEFCQHTKIQQTAVSIK